MLRCAVRAPRCAAHTDRRCAQPTGAPADQLTKPNPSLPHQGETAPQELELELLKTDTYDDVSKALASKLGLDHPLKLRLTGGCSERGQAEVWQRMLA